MAPGWGAIAVSGGRLGLRAAHDGEGGPCAVNRDDQGGAMSQDADDTATLVSAAAERAVELAVLGGRHGRRQFIESVGAATAGAALASVFPMAAARALAQDRPGPLEKRDLKIGFIPITCATPIIMAEPMGFYKKQGLNAQVLKASSWAMIRDISINGETDATHMLSPMPLAISLGVGSQSVPYVMPALENVNGQAITLHVKHKGVKSAAEMMPNTFKAILFAILDATQYARDRSHRKEIAAAIAPRNFLNQPVEVLEQVLTG